MNPLVFKANTDINDGQFGLDLISNAGIAKGTLNFMTYKPKFGTPPIRRFDLKLVTPPIPLKAWSQGKKGAAVYDYNCSEVYLSIDGVRFLPNNVTITRVTGKIYKSSSKTWIKEFILSSQPKLDEPVYCPRFDESKSIPISELSDQSSVLVLKIYTIEENTKALQVVGYSYVNLFCNSSTDLPITTKKDIDAILNFGYFQIPVFSSALNKNDLKAIAGEQALEQEFPRVPCTTMLISILDGPKKDKIVTYENGLYVTAEQNLPTDYESNLYHYVFNERKHFSVRDRLLSLGTVTRTATQTEESLNLWASKQLESGGQNIPELLNISYIAKYDFNYGFKIAIDKALNLNSRTFTVVVTSFSTNVYDIHLDTLQTTLKDDYKYTLDLDLQSELRNPEWKDGYHWYRKRKASLNLCAIFQVFSIPEDNGYPISSEGWAILPIFKSPEYVRHGRFQLPLFDGHPTMDGLQYYLNGENNLEGAIENGDVSFTNRKSSILVRLCDGRRGSELNKDSTIDYDFLGEYQTKFKPASFSSSVLSIKQRRFTDEEFTRSFYTRFIEESRLPYVP